MYTALARSRPRQVYKGELDGMTVAIKVSSSEDVAPFLSPAIHVPAQLGARPPRRPIM